MDAGSSGSSGSIPLGLGKTNRISFGQRFTRPSFPMPIE